MNKRYFKWSAFIIIALVIVAMMTSLFLKWSDPQNLASIITIIGLIAIATKYFISDYYGYKNLNIRKEEAKNSLNSIVTNLSAEDNTTKLSAANTFAGYWLLSDKSMNLSSILYFIHKHLNNFINFFILLY